MLISHSNKFIYIKTKKTAGSTIESVIVDNFFDHDQDICTGSKIDGTPRVNIGAKKPGEPDGHKPWHMVKNYVTNEQWNSYFKFTVERNPWDKVVSEFYWKQSTDADLAMKEDDVDNFELFMTKMFGSKYVAPIDWPLYSNGSDIMVDQVVQFASLKQDLVTLFNDKLGLPLTEHMLQSTRKKSGFRKRPYTELYKDSKLVDKVARHYTREIEHFNYKFGE